MSTFLYRIGRAAFVRRGLTLSVWVIVLALLGTAALLFHGPATSAITIPGTQSQRALDALQHEFPAAAGSTGTVILVAPAGSTLKTPAAERAIATTTKQVAAIPGVVAALPPSATGAFSRDGRYALIQAQFAQQSTSVPAATTQAFTSVGAAAKAQGIRVAPGGNVLNGAPNIGSTEGIGVLVAALVLVITFGSLVAAGMTLLTALIGVGIGMAGVYSLSGVISLNSTAPILALMLGLAVGIDYSLFITSRYRQNLREGHPPAEAAGRAVGTAGSAVVFAGATVVIALAGLSVVRIPFLTVMGLAAAATVVVAVLVAVTLGPAMLSFAGRRVLARRDRRATHSAGEREPRTPWGEGWARWIDRHRWPVVAVAVAVLAVLAVPALNMRLALPGSDSAPKGSPARVNYDLTSAGFGPGFNGQLAVIVHGDTAADTASAAGAVRAQVAKTAGVAAITAPRISPSRTTALLTVIPSAAPTAPATERLVHAIRDNISPGTHATLAVTGATAVGIDVSAKLAGALPIYLLLVVGLSFLLLALVFRSLLVPLKAAIGFLLTIGSTFGITVAVFEWGWLAGLFGVGNTGPLISFLPILIIGIVFGLAMDYEVFLVSRMREEFVHGAPAREAMVAGVRHGARVVVAAAIIMISVFAGFALIKDTTIKAIGFALAVGILMDAFVVRMTLVPAVMSLLDRSAWRLPRWIDRVLPDIDIEGEKLRRALAEEPTEAEEPAGLSS